MESQFKVQAKSTESQARLNTAKSSYRIVFIEHSQTKLYN